MPKASLEDAFCALLNGEGGLHAALRMANRADYSEASPRTKFVTLDCGKEAILFSGIQQMDDYGTLSDRPIWGCGTLVDDIPVIVCYIIFDEAGLEADLLDGLEGTLSAEEMEHYVVEIVNTVRIVEE